tara:strand:+ start:890 stop:1702 length:813 start_codon:yes stop_codon:yes gene_type:complete
VRVLFLGDIVGRSGRDAVINAVPNYRKTLKLDFVVVNGENAAGGFGITTEICTKLFDAGVDVITGGNHSWDQEEIIPYISSEPRLLRPVNLPQGTPGNGSGIYNDSQGRKIMIINAMGQIFMAPIDNPFYAVENVIKPVKLGASVDCILLDFHAEATSEKMAMGHFLDGRVSAVFGSHQQIPTADSQIFNMGTAYQTDAGMCGDYDSVIGMEKSIPIKKFLGKVSKKRMTPSLGDATICGVFVEVDDNTGLALKVCPLRQNGRLIESWPY